MDVYPFVESMMEPQSYWQSVGLSWAALQRLADAGLIVHHTATKLWLTPTSPFLVRFSETHAFEVTAKPDDENAFSTKRILLGSVSMTKAGAELAYLCEWDPTDRIKEFVRNYGGSMQIREVAVEDHDGFSIVVGDGLGALTRLDPN